MTVPPLQFLADLEAAAGGAEKAEDEFRRSIAARIKSLETERAFAFRRLNLMRAVAEAIREAKDEETAVGQAATALRVRLGWSTDSEARTEVVSRFAPVGRAMFLQQSPERSVEEQVEQGEISPMDALAEFEAWYVGTHPVPFWILFENVMPQTPVVDF